VEHHSIATLKVSRGTFQHTSRLYSAHKPALERYLDQLLWWNERVNLISRSVSRETIEYHLFHSLLISQFKIFNSSEYVVDAGSGGGLPGIPLAIAYPQKHVLLNDIASKKCMAVKQIARKMGLDNVSTANCSIADLQQTKAFLFISKHAFKINDLYHMSAHLPWKSMILYKGMEFEGELEGISKSMTIIRYDLSGGPSFYDGKALVIISRENSMAD